MRRLPAVILSLILLLMLPMAARASTAGPNNCGSGADISRSATAWTNPANACVTGSSATASVPQNNGATDWLVAKGFSFAIPAGATVQGIQVQFSRMASTASKIQEVQLYLVKDGVTGVGNNHASSTYWPISATVANYGGTSDLWGTAWTPADINSATFGLKFYVKNVGTTAPVAATVYSYIEITVTYTVPAGRSSIPGIIGEARSARFVLAARGKNLELYRR